MLDTLPLKYKIVLQTTLLICLLHMFDFLPVTYSDVYECAVSTSRLLPLTDVLPLDYLSCESVKPKADLQNRLWLLVIKFTCDLVAINPNCHCYH